MAKYKFKPDIGRFVDIDTGRTFRNMPRKGVLADPGDINFSKFDAPDSRSATKSDVISEQPSARKAQDLQDDPTPEVRQKASDPEVQDAAAKNPQKLKELGLKGAMGVAALMILTGESNPLKAIESALDTAEETADAARDTASGLFKGLRGLIDFITDYGLWVCLVSCCCIFMVAMFMVMT